MHVLTFGGGRFAPSAKISSMLGLLHAQHRKDLRPSAGVKQSSLRHGDYVVRD